MRKREDLRPIDLAHSVGLSVQMVRNYEQWGFIPPAERAPNGYRRYTPRHLRALKVARVMIDGYGWQSALRIMQSLHRDDLPTALAAVDARHAELHARRREAEETLKLLRVAANPRRPRGRSSHGTAPAIGEVARQVGVRVSAIRFWEAQGLLHPEREQPSGYRRYDEAQIRRLQVIVLLRQAGYGFDAIRQVLDQLAAGRPAHAIAAAEQRLKELTGASRRCAEATAVWWAYATGDAHAE